MSTDLSSRIEAFLFSEGGTLTLRKLAQLLDVKEHELAPALTELGSRLKDRGITLVHTSTEASLVLSPETSQEIREAYQRELGRDIGDAGLEVLSIVLYRGPSTRAQIDYIRGVNTSSTIRTLLARGLLDRTPNPDDAREYLYRPTTELLAHLGVRTSDELPDYVKIGNELKTFEAEASPFIHGNTPDTVVDGSGASESQKEIL
ncbi:MAG: SMC-Scp complex subunit ScpB [bacterium]|nr:SMC-Scp complex subunit ScpB [bacterium]